ncbi:MAG: hypothetical protein R6U27_17230 [Desulfobacterales bacterium]
MKAGRYRGSLFLIFPLASLFIHAAARHYRVDMRMEINSSVMRLQYHCHAISAPKFFGLNVREVSRCHIFSEIHRNYSLTIEAIFMIKASKNQPELY